MAFRTHNFSLRLTSQEIDAYSRLAEENGVPISEWMRNVLNAEVRHKEEIVRSYLRRESNRFKQEKSDETT